MKHIGIVDVTTVGACICANELVLEANRRGLNDQHPEFSLHAFPFNKYKTLVFNQEWDKVADLIVSSIRRLQKAGAEFAILPVNTIHYAFNKIEELSPLPVLNLIELTADECLRRGFTKVAVLGTKLTMEQGLYDEPLKKRGISPIIPAEDLRNGIQHLIFNEILLAQIQPQTVATLAKQIQELECDAVILGCTELPEVYNKVNLQRPVIDTTRLLAHKALDYALDSQ